MKHSPLALLPLLALLVATVPAAIPAADSDDDAVPIVQLAALPTVRIGATPDAVRRSLGGPSQVLPPDVWVYWEFESGRPDAKRAGFDTLVVKFEHGRVAEARLVSGARVRALLAAHGVAVAGTGTGLAKR
jgi:hypothetical protein